MHVGRNIARLRGFKGIKQGDIAGRLKMSQQNYSLIEQSSEVGDETLARIAAELGYDTEFIRELPDVPYVYSKDQQGGNVIHYELNPIEKIVELYERLLESEREKLKLLEAAKGKP